MPIEGCSSCSGDAALEVAQFMRDAQMEQVRVAEALATQNVALQIDASAAVGVADQIDITV